MLPPCCRAAAQCLPVPALATPPALPRPQVVKSLCEMINKKDKKANVKPFMAKNYLWVFVNCLIENPAFDSQVRWGWRAGMGAQAVSAGGSTAAAAPVPAPLLPLRSDRRMLPLPAPPHCPCRPRTR